VAKLFFENNDFREELNYQKLIMKVDPSNKFTVKMKGAYKISGKCVKYSDSITQCLKREIRDIENSEFNQIIMEYGGYKLYDYNKYTLTFVDFIRLFKAFIAGMITLQEHNIIHRDITPRTVLIDMNKNKINLIDFGLMCKHYTELYSNKSLSMYRLSHLDYPFYPPEFFIAYLMLYYRQSFENNKEAFDKFIDGIYPMLENHRFFRQQHLLTDNMLLNEYQEGIKLFLQQIKDSGFTKCCDIFNRDMAMKADVFAVASIISTISKKIKFTSFKERDFVNFLYTKCLTINPYDRITFSKLYTLLDNVNQKNNSLQGGYFIPKSKKMKVHKMRHFFTKEYANPCKLKEKASRHRRRAF
jgi:serine/threonine protein kinase